MLPEVAAMYWKFQAKTAALMFRIVFRQKTRKRSEYLLHLEEKLSNQADEIRSMQLVLEHRNKERKALNILVACDGNCNRAYMDDPSSVDRETVQLVLHNAERLVHWWNRGGHKASEKYLEQVNDIIKQFKERGSINHPKFKDDEENPQ